MSLPLKKIYIDSRYRTPDSVSTSAFKFQLARNVQFPKNTVFYLEDVSIPNTWLTVEKDLNDKIYFKFPDGTVKAVTIDQNQYTATSLTAEMNSKISAASIACTVIANTSFNNISITSPNQFYLLTDDDVVSLLKPTNGPRSLNTILGNRTGTSPLYGPNLPFTSGFLQLTHNDLYITSPNLGTYTTLGPRGEMNILRKVPVTSTYGYLIVDQATSNHAYLDCSEQTLNTMEFEIRDVAGNIVDLHGHHVSFALVFSAHSEDGPR
jgi:hypothetical protein